MPPLKYDAPREIFDFTNFVYSPSFVDFGLSLSGKKRSEIDSLACLPGHTIIQLQDGSVYAEGQASVHELEWLFGDPVREFSRTQHDRWETIARCVSTKIALGGTLIHDFRNLRSFRQTGLRLYSENALRTGDSNSYRIRGEVDDIGAQLTVQAFAVQHHDWYGFDKADPPSFQFFGIDRPIEIQTIRKTKVTLKLGECEVKSPELDFLTLASSLSDAFYKHCPLVELRIFETQTGIQKQG